MKKVLSVVFAFVLGFSCWALPLSVTYIEGKVEKQKATAWIVLKEGDTVEATDMVRLAKASMVEFSDGKRKIVLSAAGTFSLDSLAKAGAEQTAKRSGTVDKLAKLVSSQVSTQTTAAGVRGDLIGAGVEKMSWAGEDEDVTAIIESAKALITEKKYDEAAATFAKAVEAGEGDVRDQASYGQSFALAASGSTLKAIKILRGMPAVGTWSGPRAVLLARLDLESGATEEAVMVLQAAINSGSLAGEDLDLARSMLKEAGVK